MKKLIHHCDDKHYTFALYHKSDCGFTNYNNYKSAKMQRIHTQ